MEILNELQKYVDIGIICIYLFSGIIAKRLTILPKLSAVWKTILLGTLTTFIYVYMMHLDGNDIEWTKVLFSYALATSFYEVLLKMLFTKLGINQNNEQANTTTNTCECIENDYYDARELSPNDLDTLLNSGDYFEDIVYCNEMIYFSTIDTVTLQPQIQSYFVGTRPPKKPVRI